MREKERRCEGNRLRCTSRLAAATNMTARQWRLRSLGLFLQAARKAGPHATRVWRYWRHLKRSAGSEKRVKAPFVSRTRQAKRCSSSSLQWFSTLFLWVAKTTIVGSSYTSAVTHSRKYAAQGWVSVVGELRLVVTKFSAYVRTYATYASWSIQRKNSILDELQMSQCVADPCSLWSRGLYRFTGSQSVLLGWWEGAEKMITAMFCPTCAFSLCPSTVFGGAYNKF